jgi:hypothetical protein
VLSFQPTGKGVPMSQLPDPAITTSIWIGVIGKTLVKKGVLTQTEIIAELNDVKSRLKNSSTSAAIIAEIDNMISVVKKW